MASHKSVSESRLPFITGKSRELYQRTVGVLIEASSSSSRGPVNFGKYPIFMERGNGSRIYDVDGNEYIDWMMAYGALPLGHGHPRVVEAVAAGMEYCRPLRFATAGFIPAWTAEKETSCLRNPGTKPAERFWVINSCHRACAFMAAAA